VSKKQVSPCQLLRTLGEFP